MRHKAPCFLKPETKRWFNEVCKSFDLESHHLRILSIACQSWDRLTEAREAVKRDGLFTKDRYGTLKPHPGVKIELDNMGLFIKAIRELGFDIEKGSESHRPPRLY
jgi:phage terminase small subunit